jgi:hypothetical protein
MLLCYILFIYNDNPSIISIARPSGKQYLRNMLNLRSGDQNYYLKKINNFSKYNHTNYRKHSK